MDCHVILLMGALRICRQKVTPPAGRCPKCGSTDIRRLKAEGGPRDSSVSFRPAAVSLPKLPHSIQLQATRIMSRKDSKKPASELRRLTILRTKFDSTLHAAGASFEPRQNYFTLWCPSKPFEGAM